MENVGLMSVIPETVRSGYEYGEMSTAIFGSSEEVEFGRDGSETD
jgi:hypothetical protein